MKKALLIWFSVLMASSLAYGTLLYDRGLDLSGFVISDEGFAGEAASNLFCDMGGSFENSGKTQRRAITAAELASGGEFTIFAATTTQDSSGLQAYEIADTLTLPEPATVGLLGFGVMVMFAVRMKSK